MKKTAHKNKARTRVKKTTSPLWRGLLQFFFMIPVLLLAILSISSISVEQANATAGLNRTINFQGRVVNKSDGTNVTNGNYTFVFKIYDSSSGGTKLWGDETQSSVPVANGVFQVALGSVRSFATDNLDFNQDNLWLDITFNGESFGSRVRLAAVPQAFLAEKTVGLTVASGKTLTANNSITLAGTDSKTLTVSDSTTLGTNAITLGGGEVITFSATNAVTFTTSGTTSVTLPTSGTLLSTTGGQTVSGTLTLSTNSSTGLTVGANGSTNPVLQIDDSATSVATGLKIAGAATGGTTALTVIDSGSNANLSLDAKGSGTVTINATATGGITLGRATTITTGGLTVSSGNATLATGALVLGATTRISNAGVGTFASTTGVTGSNATYFQIDNGTGFYRLYTDLTAQKDFAIADDSGISKLYFAGNGQAASRIPFDAVGVGPGNTTPHAALDIQGGTYGGNVALLANQIGATTNDIFTASASGTTRFTIQNNGTIKLPGSSSGYTGFIAAASSPSLIYTLPSSSPGSDGYVLASQTDGTLSWVANGSGGGCSSCVQLIPVNTAANTVSPSANATVGLTVNTTTGTAADAVDIITAHTSGTSTNGLLFNQNAAGTTTNGIQVEQTSGTLTNGLTFTGTIGTDITTGTSGRALTIGTNGAGAITINPGGAAGLSLGTSNANAVTIGTTSNTTTAQGSFVVGTSGNTFTFNPASGPVYAGTARPTKTIVLSPEYAGATLTADGDSNITGSMTSDNTLNAGSIGWKNYYQWTSTVASPLQDYTVAVRVTLPQDFDSWQTGSCGGSSCALEIAYQTGVSGTTDNTVSVQVNNAELTPGTVICTISATSSTTWTTFGCTSTTLATSPTWNSAGATAIIRIKLAADSVSSALARVGDITLRYYAKF